MKREDVLSRYRVDENGVITSPGKFEGEKIYMPYFYEESMFGYSQEEEGVYSVEVYEEDKSEFPELDELENEGVVRWIEQDDGRVVEVG